MSTHDSPKLKTELSNDTKAKDSNGKIFGYWGIVLAIPSLVGIFAFTLILITGPLGIIFGFMAKKRGYKSLGNVGIYANAFLIILFIVVLIL